MKRKLLLIIIGAFVLALAITQITTDQSKAPLAKHIENQTNYTVYDCIDENGEVDVVIAFQDEKEQELYSQYCARIVLDAIRHFPRQAEDMPKEGTIRLYNKSTKQVVLRISGKGERFLETSWGTLMEDQMPSNVDYYYFYNT